MLKNLQFLNVPVLINRRKKRFESQVCFETRGFFGDELTTLSARALRSVFTIKVDTILAIRTCRVCTFIIITASTKTHEPERIFSGAPNGTLQTFAGVCLSVDFQPITSGVKGAGLTSDEQLEWCHKAAPPNWEGPGAKPPEFWCFVRYKLQSTMRFPFRNLH